MPLILNEKNEIFDSESQNEGGKSKYVNLIKIFGSRLKLYHAEKLIGSMLGYAGPILESKGMRAIFQKKGKKGQNI